MMISPSSRVITSPVETERMMKIDPGHGTEEEGRSGSSLQDSEVSRWSSVAVGVKTISTVESLDSVTDSAIDLWMEFGTGILKNQGSAQIQVNYPSQVRENLKVVAT